MNKVLELRCVEKQYHRGGMWRRGGVVHALRGVSLSLHEGACLAIIGASGSGKSTLGRIALGVEAPDAGEVLYRGRSLSALTVKERKNARRNVQVVFQNCLGAVNPRFTGLEIIAEPLRYFDRMHGAALRARAEELAHAVGLASTVLQKRPHALSGGELQRLCLARALAPEASVIVLDEALSALDMLTQSTIVRLLVDVRRMRGTAFLFISHDLRAVGRIADAVAVMDQGCVAAYADDVRDGEQMRALGLVPAYKKLVDALLPLHGYGQ